MTTTTLSRATRRTALSATCLAVGMLFGLFSVYATSRAGCAVWVAIAIVLTFASGLLFGSGRARV